MIHFKFNDNDSRYLFLIPDDKTDIAICRKLLKEVNLVDPICNLPKYKGPIFTNDYIWEYTQKSGKVIFYSSIGMWNIIYKYFKNNNVQFDGLDESRFKRKLNHTFDEFKEIVHSWNLKFEPRPYQYETAYKILQWKRCVVQAATRAGKTLIAYLVFRYCKEYLDASNILMIVPSIDLVKQGYADFNEYGEFFDTECIWSGGKLVQGSDLTIGTFQSLIKFLDKGSKKYDPTFFNKFDIVFCDETHRATAAQTKTIITQPFIKDCKIMFGMTGTLPAENTSERFGVHSLLGAKVKTITPKELQDNGYISKVHIHQIRLHYKDQEKQLNEYLKAAEYVLSDYVMIPIQDKNGNWKKEKKKLSNPYFLYQHEKKLPDQIKIFKSTIYNKYFGPTSNNLPQSADREYLFKIEYKKYLDKVLSLSSKGNKLQIEKMMLHSFTERIDYMLSEILPNCDKNTLILAHHTSYIKYMVELIKERFPNRKIETVIGAVSAKKREEIRLMMKSRNDVIIIASYACMSTGLTLANLCYGIFMESFKSNTVNMQSIGRGLGLSDLKDEYILYDINDCFSSKLASNKFELQANEKCKIYRNEENQYPFDIKEVKLPLDRDVDLNGQPFKQYVDDKFMSEKKHEKLLKERKIITGSLFD